MAISALYLFASSLYKNSIHYLAGVTATPPAPTPTLEQPSSSSGEMILIYVVLSVAVIIGLLLVLMILVIKITQRRKITTLAKTVHTKERYML